MAKQRLIVDIPEDIYERFMETVTREGGPWRGRRQQETFTGAVESAVYAAFILFLQGLDGDSELPEFRDYAHEKYPYLDEDTVTMIEDLIKRGKERLPQKV